MATKTHLEGLRELRAKLVEAWGSSIEARETERAAFEARTASEDNKPTDAEIDTFRAAEDTFKGDSDRREAEIKELDERIRQMEDVAQRRADAAGNASVITNVVEPLTYNSHNAKEVSYFKDLAATHNPQFAAQTRDPGAAQARLQRHAQEMDVEMPKRDAERERRAQARIDAAEREFRGNVVGARRGGLDASPFERRINPNRTDGQGGYFVPPLWLIDDYIPGLRAGRVAAGLCRSMDLPQGTDSINIPKLSTLTSTAVQTADAAGVSSTDFTDTSVSAGVKTISGQEDVSIQLIEQSPGQIIDRVVIEDLMADYNKQVDAQVVKGSGASGQVMGLFPSTNWASTNAVTWTSSTPYGYGFNMVLGAMASNVATTRFNLSSFAFLLHPRRWFWFATALDGASGTAGRPVVSGAEFGPFNASAIQTDEAAEGLVGRSPFGPNVYIDANVPTNDSSTRDVALAALWDDCWLFEGDLRTRVLPEVLSGTLQVRFQVFNYVAFLVRYGQSLAVASGTGFSAPASAIDSSVTF